MSYQSVFDLLSDISKKINIRFVLIGGFALNYYKYARQTLDVDFLITKRDFEKILPFLGSAGYTVESRQDVFVRLVFGKGDFLMMDIDFMFVDEETLGKILEDSPTTEIAGCRLRVPSLENLIAMKLHAIKHNQAQRLAKDISDIINLIKINQIDAKEERFKAVCLKYGTPEIYHKILEACEGE
ncbi:MAG: nucleotidyltransferase [Candidatus Omnitrophica bacterium]|nr:nucleotidyltransferase [Candidatus Omnitrophota bacterium]